MTEIYPSYISQSLEMARFQESFGRRKYRMTIVLAIVIGCIYLLEEFWGGSTYMPVLLKMGANTGKSALSEEPWRLITSIFLHAGFLHVFMNTYVLLALGNFINRIFGDARFFAIFLFSGITGSVASALAGRAAMSVGASGGLWGLFGVSAALSLVPSIYLPSPIRARLKKATMINIAINLPVSLLPMVDLWAHLGGGIGGFVAGLIFIKLGEKEIVRKLMLILTPLLGLLVILAFAFVFSHEKPWLIKGRIELTSFNIGGIDLLVPKLSKLSKREVQGEAYIVEVGELPDEPLKVMVTVLPRKDALSESVMEEQFSSAVKAISLRKQAGVMRTEAPRASKINGVFSILESFTLEHNATLKMCSQMRKKHDIKLSIYALPEAPKNVITAIDNILNSIREEAPVS